MTKVTLENLDYDFSLFDLNHNNNTIDHASMREPSAPSFIVGQFVSAITQKCCKRFSTLAWKKKEKSTKIIEWVAFLWEHEINI